MEELNDWLARPRGLDDNFLNALENGILMPLLAEVRTDRDLILEIRNNYVDVYCKGQCLANVRQYRSSKRYRVEAHEKFYPQRSCMIACTNDCKDFVSDVPMIKQNIAKHSAATEIEYEQLIIRANNREHGLNTEYFAVDRQGIAEEHARDRTDVLGVFWQRNKRKGTHPLCPVLMEIKYSQKGGVKNLPDQISRYYHALERRLPSLAQQIQQLLRQKLRLQLITGASANAIERMNRLEVSSNIAGLRIVLVLVDYNPYSTQLGRDALRKLPFSTQIDLFFLGFGMWKANAVNLERAL